MKRIVLVLGLLVASCAKREAAPSAASERVTHMGEPLKLDDSTWTVLDAKDLGKTLRGPGSIDPKESRGRFVLVRFSVINRHKAPESVLDPPTIVDDQGRETERFSMEALYVPPPAQTLGIEPLAPNAQREFATLFDVPADAKNLKLQIRGLGIVGGKRSVELGL